MASNLPETLLCYHFAFLLKLVENFLLNGPQNGQDTFVL